MESRSDKTRIEYVDLAKGLVMLLVIIGHTYTPHGIKYGIYSFHMPFFFLISGYFLRLDQTTNLRFFFQKKARAYLLPYFITCGAVLLFYAIKSVFEHTLILETVKKWLVASLYGLPMENLPGAPSKIQYIGAIWFLQALFWAETEVFIILKIKTKNTYRLLLVVVINLIAVFGGRTFLLPTNINTGLAAGTFVFLGYIIRNNELMKSLQSKKSILISLVLWGICVFCYWKKRQPFYMAYLEYPLYGLDVIGGIAGTFVFIELSKMLSKSNFKSVNHLVKIVGQNTLFIMCIHLFDLDCFGYFFENRLLLLIFRIVFDLFMGITIGYIVKSYKKNAQKKMRRC